MTAPTPENPYAPDSSAGGIGTGPASRRSVLARLRAAVVAVVALLALVGLLVGAPVLLAYTSDRALPGEVPTWAQVQQALLSPDDGSLFLGMLVVLGWVFWVAFALSVAVEVGSRLRGLRAPRLPALQVPQRMAAGLVSAVLFGFTAPLTAHSLSAPVAAAAELDPTVTDRGDPSAQASGPDGDATGLQGVGEQGTGYKVVDVRAGDSLWRVAERELGDGNRYTELWALNADREQPRGRTLAGSEGWLDLGWTLLVPVSSDAADLTDGQGRDWVDVTPGDTLRGIAEARLGDETRWPEIYDASVAAGALTPDRDPDLLYPGERLLLPRDLSEGAPGAGVTSPGGAREVSVGEGSGASTPPGPDAFEVPGQSPGTSGEGATAGAGAGTSADTRENTAGQEATGDTPAVDGQDGASRAGSSPDAPTVSPTAPGDLGETPASSAENTDGQAGSDGEDAHQSPPDVVAPAQPPAVAGPDVIATPGPVAGEDLQAPRTDTDLGEDGQADVKDDDAAVSVRTLGGVGAVLAALVLATLALSRARQHRHRRPGQRLTLPSAATAEVEHQLRGTADPDVVDLIDHALRDLAAYCHDTEAPPPPVRAARLTVDHVLELYLAEPDVLPAPWYPPQASDSVSGSHGQPTAGADGAPDGDDGASMLWAIDLPAPAAPAGSAPTGDVDDVPAPYPALVTLGHDDEDGLIFVNLEHLGSLAVQGDPADTAEMLAALAVELATSRWADGLTVTIVGAMPELAAGLDTGRIRYLPGTGRLLSDLEARAAHDRALLRDAGLDGPDDARVSGEAADTWGPEIVMLAAPVSPAEQQRLQDLLADQPPVAIAAVSQSGGFGRWTLEVLDDEPDQDSGDLYAVLQPSGLRVRPQLVDDVTYNALLDALQIAAEQADHAAGAHFADHTTAEVSSTWYADLITVVDSPTGQAPSGLDTRLLASVPPPSPATPDGTGQDHNDPEDTTDDAGEDADTDPAPSDTHTPVVAVVGHRPSPVESGGSADRQDTRTDHAVRLQDAGAVAPTDAPDAADTTAGAADASSEDAPGPAAPPASGEPGHPHGSDPELRGAPIPMHRTPGATRTAGAGIRRAAPPENVEGAPPRVLVLGDVLVLNARGPLQTSRLTRSTEVVAFLALNGRHDQCRFPSLDAALWPGERVATSTRNATISRVRSWLARDPDGNPYFPHHSDDSGYHLHPHVTSDWDDWRALLPNPDTITTTPTRNLEAALSLIRGRPFGDTKARYYTWAEYTKQQMITEIVDATHTLAHRYLHDGRWQAAQTALALGLDVEPGSEALWRLRLLAVHNSRNVDAFEETVTKLHNLVDELGGDLEPETEELLAQLRRPSSGPDTLGHLA